MSDVTPTLRSHLQRAWFERGCYRALLGIMIGYAALGLIAALIPPGVCFAAPTGALCAAQYDWGAATIAKEVQFWPVLFAIGTFLVAGPAVTLFRGRLDASTAAKQ